MNLKVFFDEDSIPPGEPIDRAIENNLRKSRHVVLFLTHEALASQWVAMELSLTIFSDPAAIKGILVPVILGEFNHAAIPLRINALNPLNLLTPGRRQPKYRLLLKTIGWKKDPYPTMPPPPKPSQRLAMRKLFDHCGLEDAFRIPLQDRLRQERVKQLIHKEEASEHPHFRLLASSGFSYIHPMGWVWRNALQKAVSIPGARFDIVLESPFSDFAFARAIACKVEHHHWKEKLSLPDLLHLADAPQVHVIVTEHPINCSLFLTKTAVLYDPYLWALPNPGGRVENNFWVFQFRKAIEPNTDCYSHLEKHFQFHLDQGITLKAFLGKNGDRYEALTKAFERKLRTKYQRQK